MEQGQTFNPGSAADIVDFQIKRNFANICKSILLILEDVRDTDSFDYEKQRKRVLDSINGSKREIESQLALFDINFKR